MLIALNMTMSEIWNPQFSLSRTAVLARVLEPLVGSPDRMNQANPLKEPNTTKRTETRVELKKNNYVNLSQTQMHIACSQSMCVCIVKEPMIPYHGQVT